MRLGVIDIGSNTVRLVIWDIYGKGFYRIVDEIKSNIRLGDTLDENNIIPSEKVTELTETLKRYEEFNRSLKTDRIITVASEAIRNSLNRDEIIKIIEENTNLKPIILDDTSEAHLDYRGVTGSMVLENSLLVDISGTNTELTWIVNNQQKEYAFLPFGTINLTKRFGLSSLVTAENHKNLEEFLKDSIEQIPWLKNPEFNKIVLVGGSARTIARIDRYRKRYPLSITHNYTMSDLDINDLYYSVLTKDIRQRNKINGLNKDRSDIILAALAILFSIQKVTNVQEFRISGKGLREGILYEHIHSNMEYIEDMLDSSIYSILARHDMEVTHSEKVTELSMKIYNSLSDILKLNKYYSDVMKTASMLHDVGNSIRFYDHEKHSFYIILNSEINGLNHKEILLAALAASFHRNNNMDIMISNFSQIINRLDVIIAERMGLIISIAESFDKSMNSVVKDVEVEINDTQIIIKPIADVDLTFEIIDAKLLCEKFEEVFHKELVILQK